MHDDDQPRLDPAAMSDREWQDFLDNDVALPKAKALAGASGASPGRHVPAPSQSRTTEARSALEARLKTERRGIGQAMSAYVSKRLEAFAKMMGDELGVTHKEISKAVAALRADVGYARDTARAMGSQVDKLVTELAALKRAHELEKQLEIQRNKRRVENLEVALLAAGRNPAERDDDADGEIPQMDWRGQHAQ
jgi:hypothetical protein